MENRNNAEVPPAYVHYPKGQENVQPGVVNQDRHTIYPTQNQPAVVIPTVTYCAPQPTVICFPGASLPNGPQDHLWYSIFVTVCCCWLVGIFAIIRSLECRSAVVAGDLATAERKSSETRKLAHIALGVGIGLYVLIIIIAPIASIFGHRYYYYGYPY